MSEPSITVHEKLSYIQKILVAPKNQYNKFGKYNYRSCEDIMEGLKLVVPDGCHVTVSDKIIQVGDRVYVEATARFSCGSDSISSTASAREPETQKGMNEAQITGSASSYARKYALNGLFAIDDVKDADTIYSRKDDAKPPEPKKELADYTNAIDTFDSREAVNDWLFANKDKVKADLTEQDTEKFRSYVTQLKKSYEPPEQEKPQFIKCPQSEKDTPVEECKLADCHKTCQAFTEAVK